MDCRAMPNLIPVQQPVLVVLLKQQRRSPLDCGRVIALG